MPRNSPLPNWFPASGRGRFREKYSTREGAHGILLPLYWRGYVPFISEESILELKRSIDIQEVVSSYFPLKRSGANYKACCPFHEEKTPSFNVHPEKQIFKCFGCQKGGDAISFVMEIENVDYPEAIKMLAQKCGVTLKYEGGRGPVAGKEEIYRANEWAVKLFRKLLEKKPEAGEARKYLAGRGVDDASAETFQLGFSMDSWDFLLSRAHREGFSDKTLLEAGLVLKRESGGCYDRFRGRLMFPIFDVRGRAIGFGARTLKDEEPKYINTPETAVFSKGRNLYGFHWIREEIRESRTLYIVEGYLDVILPYQGGIKGMVATLGTALTRDHLRLLRRYVDKVVLVFDGDEAGKKASERGMDLLLSENVDLFVAELPPKQDPADCVVGSGAGDLRKRLENPTEIFAFLLKRLASRVDMSTPGGKTRVIEEVLGKVMHSPDEVKREILLQQLAATFQIETKTLRDWVNRRAKGNTPAEPVPEPEEIPGPVEEASRQLLGMLLAEPAHAITVKGIFPVEQFPDAISKKIAAKLFELSEQGEVRVGDVMTALEKKEERAFLADLAMRDLPKGSLEDQIKGCLDTLAHHRYLVDRKKNRKESDPDEYLRKVQDSRRARPVDHGLLPGR